MADGIPKKTQDLSTVCSTKQMSHTVHAKRLEFVMALRNAMPELQVFGRGINPISEKSEAMDAYRYHIAIENHIEPGHWTEKLSDCFLAGCLPLYFGDPDYAAAFPEESVIPIDIYDFDGAMQTIRHVIETDQYTKRLPAIKAARQRVLTEYNLLKVVADIVKARHAQTGQMGAVIHGRHIIRRKHPIKAAQDAAFRLKAARLPSASPRQLSAI